MVDSIISAETRSASKASISFHLSFRNARAIFVLCAAALISFPSSFFFLRIYFPEGVASEIFQGLISPGVALLIRDREMLHSLLKLFECDSVASQLVQDARRVKDM